MDQAKSRVNLEEVKKNRTRIRLPDWWWGRYVVWNGKNWIDDECEHFPSSQVDETYEVYIEEKHGERANPDYLKYR